MKINWLQCWEAPQANPRGRRTPNDVYQRADAEDVPTHAHCSAWRSIFCCWGVTTHVAVGRPAGRVRRVPKAWMGALVTAALVMLVGCASVRAATKAPYAAACRLPQAEIHFNNLPLLGEFGGSQMRFARADVNYYPPSLGGLSISAVSATLPIDFPAAQSSVRFFYLQDNYGKYPDFGTLVGCLYFHMHGNSYVLANTYGPEGNSTPIVAAMFTLNLTHGIGQTLFVVIRWDIENAVASGTSYDLHAYYGVGNAIKKNSESNWDNFEHSGFVGRVFGNNNWVLTGGETVQSVHAYTDKASIVKRLKQLGYLK